MRATNFSLRAARAALAATALATLALGLPARPAAATELVMVEQVGCQYCARWNEEIAPIYPKTPEGSYAPLRRVDLHGPELAELGLDRRVVFTPTFVLIDENGREMARLEGYPGEDFFWGLLTKMLHERTDFAEQPASGG